MAAHLESVDFSLEIVFFLKFVSVEVQELYSIYIYVPLVSQQE